MAARPKRLARELRQAVPDLRPLEGTRQRDAGLEPLLVRRRARRVVAAQTYTPDCHFIRIEIFSLLDPTDHPPRPPLVVAADREPVLALPLPRPVDRQPGEAALGERASVASQLFLRGSQP